MKKETKYDVVIVGARAAGAATALLLARAGMNVLAVDRARYGSDTLSTHALMRTAIVQLDRWGLLDRVIASGAPPITEVTFRYPDETVPVQLTSSGSVDALYAPRRTVLDSILVDAAREAGAEVRFGVIVDDLVRDTVGRVRGLLVRNEAGQSIRIDAGLVVGADGIRSVVAQSVGAPVLRRARNSGAIVYAYYEDVETTGYEWAYAPGASAGLIPTNDGQVCVFIGGSETDFRQRVFPDLVRGFDEILREVSPAVYERVSSGERVARHRGFAGVHGYLKKPWGPGWALVGDAGYFRDPITTHGISDALRDAELVARAVTSFSSFAEYEVLRNAVVEDMFEVTDLIAGYDWTMDELRGHLRAVSKAMKPELKLIDRIDRRTLDGREQVVA